MNLKLEDIDVIIKSLMQYLDNIIDGEDDFFEIAMIILALIKQFRALRRTKLNES